MITKTITDYEDIRSTLNNGDLVLFKGKGLISVAILWFCSLFNGLKKTNYSHIGFIVKDGERIMLCESTTFTYKNSSLVQKGVRLVPLSQVLILYAGEIYIRRLQFIRTTLRDMDMENYIAKNIGKPYEKHLFELMGSARKDDWFKNNNNQDYFCSELVAGLYKLWGLLPSDKPANSYSPQEFAQDGLVDHELKYCGKAARLESAIRVK